MGYGLDVHQKVVVATIDGERIKKSTREFGTFTNSLTELRDWLLKHGITHVDMESTGVYWKPVYHIMEPTGMKVWIVNARHIKYVPGAQDRPKRQRMALQTAFNGLTQAKLYSGT
jgi:transposase